MLPINHKLNTALKDISFLISFIVVLVMINWWHPIFCLFYENLMKIKMIININKKQIMISVIEMINIVKKITNESDESL